MNICFDKYIWNNANYILPPVGERVVVLVKDDKKGTSFSVSFGQRLDSKFRRIFPAFGKGCWDQKGVALWGRLGLPQGTGDPALEMELEEIRHQISILEELAINYSGRTLDNIIQNLRMVESAKSKRYESNIKTKKS